MTARQKTDIAAALIASATFAHAYLLYINKISAMLIGGFLALVAIEAVKILFIKRCRAKHPDAIGTRMLAAEVLSFGAAVGLLFVFASPIDAADASAPITYCIDFMIVRACGYLFVTSQK